MTAADETAGLHQLTLAQAGELIGSRRLSPVEYVQALTARADAVDGQVKAYVTRTFEHALDGARKASDEITAGRYRGPLHGIPFGLKDSTTPRASRPPRIRRVLDGLLPIRDAAATKSCTQAGAAAARQARHPRVCPRRGRPSTCPGRPAKSVEPCPLHGRLLQRLRPRRRGGPGPGALGTDTGGSIRVPGVPLRHHRPDAHARAGGRAGVIPHSHTFDRSGPLARTAADAAPSAAGHCRPRPGRPRQCCPRNPRSSAPCSGGPARPADRRASA